MECTYHDEKFKVIPIVITDHTEEMELVFSKLEC